MQRSADSKAVIDDSLITVDTTSLDQQTVLLHIALLAFKCNLR